jgi:hypothetical protein
MASVARLCELFEPPEIKANTPAPRTLQLQANGASLRRTKQQPALPGGWGRYPVMGLNSACLLRSLKSQP